PPPVGGKVRPLLVEGRLQKESRLAVAASRQDPDIPAGFSRPTLKSDVSPVPGPVARQFNVLGVEQELCLAAASGRLREEIELAAPVRAEDDRLPVGRPERRDVISRIERKTRA